MPETHLDWFVMIAASAFELATLYVMRRRSTVRSFPFLTLLLCSSLLHRCLLAPLVDKYSARTSWASFDVYWGWQAVVAILRILVLWDIYGSFPGREIVQAKSTLRSITYVSLVAGSAAALGYIQQTTFRHAWWQKTMDAVTGIDRALSVAGLVCLVAVLFTVWRRRLGWSRRGALTCHALTLTIGSSLLANIGFSLLAKSHRPTIALCSIIITLTGLATFLLAMAMPEEIYALPAGSESLLPELCMTSVEKVGTTCT